MKRPLSEIIANLEMYVETCEVGIESPEPSKFFDDLRGELAEKVDGWIDYLEGLDVLLSHMEERKEYFAKKVKILKNLKERKEAYLTQTLSMSNIKEIRGANHSGFRLQRNSNPSLKFNIPINGFKHSYVLNKNNFEIAIEFPEFFEEKSFYVADAEFIKKSLKDGRKLEFADIEYGNHIKII